MSTVTYALEHFYYGQSPDHPEPQLLAKSQGVESEQVDEAVEFALIPPADTPTGSWGLIRGKHANPFVMVQAQTTPANLTVWHFIIMPSDVLRAVGGNLKAIVSLTESQVPTFSKLSTKLQQLLLDHPPIISSDEQIDDILELMNYTHNQIDIIESLLAGIVQGVPMVVQGAPTDLATRVQFLQGLSGAAATVSPLRCDLRHAHTGKHQSTPRFASTVAKNSRVKHWSMHGKKANWAVMSSPMNYSHFVASQLRLDAELVSQQTRNLTAIAAWRIKRGEGLADALGYASYRSIWITPSSIISP